jgi:hypothetical protein
MLSRHRVHWPPSSWVLFYRTWPCLWSIFCGCKFAIIHCIQVNFVVRTSRVPDGCVLSEPTAAANSCAAVSARLLAWRSVKNLSQIGAGVFEL